MQTLTTCPDDPLPHLAHGTGVQRMLPIFPAEAMPIAAGLGVLKADGIVQYFMGLTPVFTHHEDDEASFRMFAAQLCALGTCKQADLVRTLGLPKRSLIRWVDQFREKGATSFFQGRLAPNNQKRVWTETLMISAQALLDEGWTKRYAQGGILPLRRNLT